MKQGIPFSTIAMAIILGLASPALGANATWEVTVTEGDLFLLPAEEVDWRVAKPSDRMAVGDRLWAAPTGRAVVAGPAGLTLRLDRQTQVELVADAQRQQLTLLSGAIYVKHPAIGREGLDFELEAGRATLRSDVPTMMRVELLEEGAVGVAVYKGEVRLMTASDSAWVRAGERTVVTRTAMIEWPPRSLVFAQRDDFDEWNEEQELRLARGGYSYEDEGPDLAQLDGYGEWVSTGSYGRVWRPWVAVNWRPYFYGQWLWVSPYGWAWVSAEPWGWLPHHYGQWVWDAFYGWVWVPGYAWAPAWVIWTPYLDGWAWAPYGPFGVPVTVLHVSIQIHYWCWTTQLGTGGWQHHRRVTAAPTVVRHPPPTNTPHPPQFQPPRHPPQEGRRHSEQVTRLERKEEPRGSFSRFSAPKQTHDQAENQTIGREDRAMERQSPQRREIAAIPRPEVRSPRSRESEQGAAPPRLRDDHRTLSLPRGSTAEGARESQPPAPRPFIDRGAARPDRPALPQRQAQAPTGRRSPVIGAAPSPAGASEHDRSRAGEHAGNAARQPDRPEPSDSSRMNGTGYAPLIKR